MKSQRRGGRAAQGQPHRQDRRILTELEVPKDLAGGTEKEFNIREQKMARAEDEISLESNIFPLKEAMGEAAQFLDPRELRKVYHTKQWQGSWWWSDGTCWFAMEIGTGKGARQQH